MSETEAPERRTRTQHILTELSTERQQMLVLFCAVAGLEPYRCDKSVQDALQEFCQVMVDYIALGHFEVYERITEGNERRQGIREAASGLYPQIQAYTDRAVAFNDKYSTSEQCSHLETLSTDLSQLGEDLAKRIELEDELISHIMAADRNSLN